jgi:hypothetical protein
MERAALMVQLSKYKGVSPFPMSSIRIYDWNPVICSSIVTH